MWQISRCDLDGQSLSLVYSGIRREPAHFEVDPYNGYLFWSIQGFTNDTGLFRLDLSEVSNGVRREINPYTVIVGSNVSAFTIDYAQFSLFIPNSMKNTVFQIDFDGKKEEDIRTNNTQSAEFTSVTSIAIADRKFYWTDGPAIFFEGFHKVNNKYYQTKFFDFAKMSPYFCVGVNSPTAQPIPVPTHPPSNVQVVLGERSGKVSWNTPHLLSIQGASSWQDWNYTIEITNEDDNATKSTVHGIKGLTQLILDLVPNTNYRVRVAAYTKGGIGQFSSEFRAKTLRTSHERSLMWSSNDGLLQSDILGDHVHVLVPKIQLGSANITGIAWYKDTIYYISNYMLFHFNRVSGDAGQVGVESVQSIAVDWIGKRLYWFNPIDNYIKRGDLFGGEKELLYSPIARGIDLKIDSHRGYMYFSSGNSVEYCRLNGRHCGSYYRNETVMGLTLDMDNERVYWIVRSIYSSRLLMAPMAGTAVIDLKSTEYVVHEKDIQGPLSYFSDRLLWLQDDQTAVISNVTGRNLAHLRHIKLNGLKTFAIIDPTQQTRPANITGDVHVIPDQLNASSIRVTGTAGSFNITWDPVQNVNYGQVFYEIHPKNLDLFVSDASQPYIHIRNESLPPYTPINISVRAFTYWGASKKMEAQIYSPPATPTKPTNARIFLSHAYDVLNGGLNITATLRWNAPVAPNGPLGAYVINCWYDQDDITHMLLLNVSVPVDQHEMIVGNLMADATYFFEIGASTSVGMGNFTAPLSINTNHERPIPHVLVSTPDAILRVDMDLQRTEVVVKTRSPATHMAYISLHDELFWIDETDVMTLRNGSRQKLCIASKHVLSMSVDWIERLVYWTQFDTHGMSTLFAYDLNTKMVVDVLKRSGYMYGLTVVPQLQRIMWIEQNSADDLSGQLLSYTLHQATSDIEPYLNASQEPIFAFHKVLVLDTSAREQSHVLWVAEDDTLHITDLSRSVSTAFGHMYNENTSNLVKDSGWLYWTDENNNMLTNHDAFHRYKMHMHNDTVLGMLALNQQEYPPMNCLLPNEDTAAYDSIRSEGSGARSIVLRLPVLPTAENCTRSPPSIKYVISYRSRLTNDTHTECTPSTCREIYTYDSRKEVTELKPFTRYDFQMRVENHYSRMRNLTIGFGPFVTFATMVDAPSKPRNVYVEAINPTEALVTWTPPSKFNGNEIWYEVHWQTKHSINGVRNRQQLLVNDSNTVTIGKLLPNQVYNVWVRAYTTNTLFNQSDALEIETFPEPRNLTLNTVTAGQFDIHWTPYRDALNCAVSYKLYNNITDPWKNVYTCHELNHSFATADNIIVDHLQPKTQYLFVITMEFARMKLSYEWERHFVFETLPGRPNAPGKPNIKHVSGDVYKVFWTPALNNGAEIETYSLEALRYSVNKRDTRSTDTAAAENRKNVDTLRYTTMVTAPPLQVDESEPLEDSWTTYYNGSDTHWIIKDLVPIDKYSFRVRARNSFGWSEYSELSDIINAPLPSSEEYAYMMLATVVPISIALLIVLILCLFCSTFHFFSYFVNYFGHASSSLILFSLLRSLSLPLSLSLPAFRKKKDDKGSCTKSELELGTIRSLPRGGVHADNILYSPPPPLFPIDVESASLPVIHREQITMSDKLGSGAFGEVYAGCVYNVNDELETRVAIKTLPKGASEHEKSEFLQEAHLMSNFKHEHILQLIGVCWENDALYIIMELMEGGDLLSYLRQNRPVDVSIFIHYNSNPIQIVTNLLILQGSASALTLLDLVSMCVDIASGCRYLEEMHFVHRDLACRNCLVSSSDPSDRVVKIGDFGLARDVYKNDYYRNGKGLLPVRWMPPESLADGVFTSQSDIWAFGVLCWEVMTMGLRPYPAMGNQEVMHYVAYGGRLGRHINCPEEL